MDPGPYRRAARELAGSPFASIAFVDETGSTNADAAELLGDERFAGHTIVAEFQRYGAGRKGRSWQAMPGTSLLFSTILPKQIGAEQLWLVPFWTALGVRAGLRECGVPSLLQWPNDLLLEDRKLAGILCTSRVTGNRAYVACGVGINVRRLAGAAAAISPPPAFCEDLVPVDRARLLPAILRAYSSSLDLLEDAGAVVAEWQTAAELPGRRYRLQIDGTAAPFEAVAEGLERGGALRVIGEDGARRSIALADARVLR